MPELEPLRIDFPAFEAYKDQILAAYALLRPDSFATYALEAEDVAADAQRLYREYCGGRALPSGRTIRVPSGTLANGCQIRATGFLRWQLFNEISYAQAIEEGTKERDMKKSLATAPRARRAKDGHLYLIIPFRHGSPGARGFQSTMPKAVHQAATGLERSYVTKATFRLSATGHIVPAWRYHWGGKLDRKALAELGASPAEVRRFAGLVKMGAPGHNRQNSYMTFRVMSEKSPAGSWIKPATPGLWPLKSAIETAISDGSARLDQAVVADFMGFVGL